MLSHRYTSKSRRIGHVDRPDALQRPIAIDGSILTGHESIKKHTKRLSCKNYIVAAQRSAELIREITKGPYRFYIMSAFHAEGNRNEPVLISAEEAEFIVDLLTLPPSADRNLVFATAHGLVANEHMSRTRTQAIYDRTPS